MNLFELKEEIEDTQSNIDFYREEKIRLESKVGIHSTRYDKEITSGGKLGTREEALLELTQTEIYLDDAIKKLDNLIRLRDKKYNIFINSNDYDKQIYTEKKMLKWSNSKISARHNGLGKSSIYRIVEKIESMGKSGKL